MATITHGAITGTNTIHNILHDPILNKNADETASISKEPVSNVSSTVPEGRLEIEPGRMLSVEEQRIADKLVAEGKQVRVPKEIENQAGVRNPDFEIDGVKTELKTVSNIKKIDADGLSA